MSLQSFIHRYEPASIAGRPPILLLHGTGGDEKDLVPLGHMIAPGSALLSPRGKVIEHGAPRFFRRLAEGVFDEEDVRRRAHELADFIAAAREKHGITAPVALGFSNGANIAAAMLILRPEALAGGILLRAMVPLKDGTSADLGGKPLLIISGAQDPIIPPQNSAQLARLLSAAGATVDHRSISGGHMLSQADVAIAADWLKHHFPSSGQ